MEIKDGAVFVADAHDGDSRKNFLTLLKKISKGEIMANQLFLLGDMFDLLVNSKQIILKYKNQINLINQLATKMEIYYIEGNHDFGLKNIFPNIKVFDISNQPVEFKYRENIVMLSHGDIYNGFRYKIFSYILRSGVVLSCFKILDFILKFKLSSTIFKMQDKKNLVAKNLRFEKKIGDRVKNYKNCDFIIEGHFHQNREAVFKSLKYLNLPPFGYNPIYIRLIDYTFIKFHIYSEKKI